MLKSVHYYQRVLLILKNILLTSSRFCGLWLGNSEDEELNQVVVDFVNQLPSFKIVPWINQLSSKLVASNDKFQNTLWSLLVKVTTDHPYHCLYQFLSLKVGDGASSGENTRQQAGKKFWGESL